MQKSLSIKIFIYLFIGFSTGSLIKYVIPPDIAMANWIVIASNSIGSMFVSLIKLLVVPLVFFSIVCGVCELKDVKSFGRLGSKTFAFYIFNTIIAISFALLLGYIFNPGLGANLTGQGVDVTLTETGLPNLVDLVVNIIPSNPVESFASGDMLQIIFMAILTGIAIQSLGNDSAKLKSFFSEGNKIMMKLITLVMSLSPYGVGALMLHLGATLDFTTIMSLASYVLLIVGCLIFWILVVYPFVVRVFTGIKSSEFRNKTREQFLFSLSTASSNATIPVTMRTLTEKLNVSPKIAGFGVPLGATMNMSGVSIYISIAAVFLANAYGHPIDLGDYVTIGFSILLLSIGAGGVPGGGIVMIGVISYQLGFPLEGWAILAAVDRICDMFCTSANVIGDTAVNTIVAKSEDKLESHPSICEANSSDKIFN